MTFHPIEPVARYVLSIGARIDVDEIATEVQSLFDLESMELNQSQLSQMHKTRFTNAEDDSHMHIHMALPSALTAVFSLGVFGSEDISRANNCTKARAATSARCDRPCQTVTLFTRNSTFWKNTSLNLLACRSASVAHSLSWLACVDSCTIKAIKINN